MPGSKRIEAGLLRVMKTSNFMRATAIDRFARFVCEAAYYRRSRSDRTLTAGSSWRVGDRANLVEIPLPAITKACRAGSHNRSC
jgi:hypothetical protein